MLSLQLKDAQIQLRQFNEQKRQQLQQLKNEVMKKEVQPAPAAQPVSAGGAA